MPITEEEEDFLFDVARLLQIEVTAYMGSDGKWTYEIHNMDTEQNQTPYWTTKELAIRVGWFRVYRLLQALLKGE